MTLCRPCERALKRICPISAQCSTKTTVLLPQHSPRTAEECWVCYKFSSWLQTRFSYEWDLWHQGPVRIEFQRFNHAFMPLSPGHFKLGMTAQLAIHGKDLGDICMIEIHLIPSQEYEEACLPLSEWPCDTEEELDVVKRWIEICDNEHSRCDIPTVATFYPTRLLLLDPNGRSMRLIHTDIERPRTPYVTLSHRWGSEKFVMLNSRTMEQFKKGLITSDFPEVFRNAITLTIALGIKYIWIDALCIKQDADKLDWETEAKLMHKVYSHTYLNISATLSRNGDETLFGPRRLGPFYPSPFNFRRQGRSLTYYIVDGDMWADDIVEAPLQTRGWVYQERFLSKRVLHLGERQLGWECDGCSALSLFPNGLPAGFVVSTRASLRAKLMSPGQRGSVDSQMRKAWVEVVANYSRCDLTVGEDKLIAFAGVAQMIEDVTNDVYIAGFWKSTLLFDLAWRREKFDSIERPHNKTSHRAPSWSWLSVDGEVYLPEAMGDTYQTFARVVDYPSVDQAGSVVYAAQGTIELEAVVLPLTSVTWKDRISSCTVAGYLIKEGILYTESHLDMEGSRDDIDDLVQRGVMVVPLFATNLIIHAIAVTRVSGASYRRVGACQVEYRVPGPAGQKAVADGWELEKPQRVDGSEKMVSSSRNIVASALLEHIENTYSRGGQERILFT